MKSNWRNKYNGRDDHTYAGRYAIFPGENLEAHLITYFDGVFNLPGKTGSSGLMTEYAINVDDFSCFSSIIGVQFR